MKPLLFFLAVMTIGCGSNQLANELVRMRDEDQAIRREAAGLGPYIANNPEMIGRMRAIDSANTFRLKQMLGTDAWFTKKRAGGDGLEAAFILIQHSPDYDFQKRALPYIETQAKTGDLSMQDYALLLDRTLIHDNKPQVYGTQVEEVNGEWVPYPIEDSLNVDARRKEIDLMPMSEYMEIIQGFYRKK